MKRQCGDCQLCCKLLPVKELDKDANTRCKFQRFHKGCSVYHTPKMPMSCHLWSCMWLLHNDTEELERPDKTHYVIDVYPDAIGVLNNETGEAQTLPVVVVWCDPKYPDAHRDPMLREYLLRRANEGIACMVRYNSYDTLIIFAPQLCTERRWMEVSGKASTREEVNALRRS